MSTRSPAMIQPAVLGSVLSVQAGKVQRLGTPGAEDPVHRPWRSAFFKGPIHGVALVGVLGVEGDEQADRKHHGGPDQAILMYSADHFPDWRAFGLEELGGGGFGENLTVAGFSETDVCIGDRLRVGTVLLEVTQPRQPCSNINRRWERKGVTEAVVANGRGGWYLRVIETGALKEGDPVDLASRPHPGLTIAQANDALYRRSRERRLFESLLGCAEMPDGFKRGLRARMKELEP